MKKNSKTFFLLWGLFVFLVIINFWGCDKSATSTNHPDPFYQNIDSSVTMIAKINDIPYYGKEYKDPYPPNIWCLLQ